MPIGVLNLVSPGLTGRDFHLAGCMDRLRAAVQAMKERCSGAASPIEDTRCRLVPVLGVHSSAPGAPSREEAEPPSTGQGVWA